LKRVPGGVAGVFTALLPASAAVVAVVFLGETINFKHGIGFALMMVSILISTWPSQR